MANDPEDANAGSPIASSTQTSPRDSSAAIGKGFAALLAIGGLVGVPLKLCAKAARHSEDVAGVARSVRKADEVGEVGRVASRGGAHAAATAKPAPMDGDGASSGVDSAVDAIGGVADLGTEAVKATSGPESEGGGAARPSRPKARGGS
jgi:hypothetical protein